jgi:hydroxypyruvate reductase
VTSIDPRRQLLLELFQAGLARVDGRRCTRDALCGVAIGPTARVWTAAIGKAASAMMLGARDALGAAQERVLLITKDGHVDPEARLLPDAEIYESAHPLPDARSITAGERLLRWTQELPKEVEPLFLISGGASSLVEALAEGVTLDELKRQHNAGLASGVAITELNENRARLSRIKGGRLTAYLRGRHARALFISDVPGDDPAVIGSGLLGPAAASRGSDHVERRVVASIDDAVAAVSAAAQARGFAVRAAGERFDGDVRRLAVRFTHELDLYPEGVHVWGGESVVRLPPRPGHGGRNQHLALAAARIIAGRHDLLLLAAGTDGTDGTSADAGALVDGESCARVALAEIDVEQSLQSADSGTALAAAGDLIHTGPTGTNVGDLVIGLKCVSC